MTHYVAMYQGPGGAVKRPISETSCDKCDLPAAHCFILAHGEHRHLCAGHALSWHNWFYEHALTDTTGRTRARLFEQFIKEEQHAGTIA